MGALPNRAKLNHVSIETHGFGVFYFQETSVYYVICDLCQKLVCAITSHDELRKHSSC